MNVHLGLFERGRRWQVRALCERIRETVPPDAPLIIDHTGVYLRPEHAAWITATVPDDDGPCGPDDWEPDHAQFDDMIWPRLYNRAEGFDAVKVQRF